jgi:ClpP class serine protease
MWLIQQSVLREMRAMASLGVTPTQTQTEQFAQLMAEAPEAAAARITRKGEGAGATAELDISGVLTERPNLMAMLFGMGGTSYQAVRTALAQADADPQVKSLIVNMSSPGGHVDGLFDTIAAFQAFSKPVVVRASNAQSAAYALAAAAGPIEATGPAATFGSVGVVAGMYVDDDMIEITNTSSPNKRPDVKTPEGKAVVREHLDALQELFVGAIAEGRAFHAADGKSITAKVVDTTFGRGGTLLAGEAKRLKMIDRAPQPALRAVPARGAAAAAEDTTKTTAATQDGGTPRKSMNREEIRAQFPAVYEAIVAEATAAGKAEGETKERKRVSAHLLLGNKCGAMEFAMKCIAEGKSTLDEDVHAEYLGAAANRSDQRNRQADSDAASAAADGSAGATEATGKDFGDLVTEEFLKNRPRKAG